MNHSNFFNAAIIIIGNEILSGRTQDLNSNYLAKRLASEGINLMEVRIIPDDEKIIIQTLNLLRANFSYVFTSGGIGPTHDDITAESVASAFKVPIEVNKQATKVLATNYPNGELDLTPARLRMARIPRGATLIENPISKAPGFRLENVFVLAGIPKIFQAMVDSVIGTIQGGDPLLSISVRVRKIESEIAEDLSDIAKQFKNVSIGSYPFEKNGHLGTNLIAIHRDKKLLKKVKISLERLKL